MKNYIKFLLLFTLLIPGISYAQDVNIKIGHRDSVQSKILNETRNLVISLPKGYETTDQNYSVLYLLDGNEAALMEAHVVTRKLRTDMIIVAIPNTNRDRDMMPLSAPSYEVKNPQADKFLSFIEEELIPYIDNKYRSNKERTIRGSSLSGLFVMYAFLAKPELFSNYIGNCAGWFADMDAFFNTLADEAFQTKDRFNGKKLFVANSLADPLDPNQEIHQAMLDFSIKLESVLGDRIKYKYATYENAGHVPFPSFYDGLKFVFDTEVNQTDGNKSIEVVKKYHEIWSTGKVEELDDIIATNFKSHFIGGFEYVGIEGAKKSVLETRAAFPDWEEKIVDIIVEGNKVVTRYYSTGTHLGNWDGIDSTGNKVGIEEMSIYYLENGKIVEQWGCWDEIILKKQMAEKSTDKK